MSFNLVKYAQYYQRPLNNSTQLKKKKMRKEYNNLCSKNSAENVMSLFDVSLYILTFMYCLQCFLIDIPFYLKDNNLILTPKFINVLGKLG